MDKKDLVVGGIVLAALGGVAIWAATRDGEGGGDGGGGGDLELAIYDQDHNRVAGALEGRDNIEGVSAGMVGGGTYTADVTLANTSVYTGTSTPAPYTFKLTCIITVGTTQLINVTRDVAMAAGETGRHETFNFTIPVELSGNGNAAANLKDQSLVVIQGKNLAFTVGVAPVTPGGTVAF